jgi:hypothetical protein
MSFVKNFADSLIRDQYQETIQSFNLLTGGPRSPNLRVVEAKLFSVASLSQEERQAWIADKTIINAIIAHPAMWGLYVDRKDESGAYILGYVLPAECTARIEFMKTVFQASHLVHKWVKIDSLAMLNNILIHKKYNIVDSFMTHEQFYTLSHIMINPNSKSKESLYYFDGLAYCIDKKIKEMAKVIMNCIIKKLNILLLPHESSYRYADLRCILLLTETIYHRGENYVFDIIHDMCMQYRIYIVCSLNYAVTEFTKYNIKYGASRFLYWYYNTFDQSSHGVPEPDYTFRYFNDVPVTRPTNPRMIPTEDEDVLYPPNEQQELYVDDDTEDDDFFDRPVVSLPPDENHIGDCIILTTPLNSTKYRKIYGEKISKVSEFNMKFFDGFNVNNLIEPSSANGSEVFILAKTEDKLYSSSPYISIVSHDGESDQIVYSKNVLSIAIATSNKIDEALFLGQVFGQVFVRDMKYINYVETLPRYRNRGCATNLLFKFVRLPDKYITFTRDYNICCLFAFAGFIVVNIAENTKQTKSVNFDSTTRTIHLNSETYEKHKYSSTFGSYLLINEAAYMAAVYQVGKFIRDRKDCIELFDETFCIRGINSHTVNIDTGEMVKYDGLGMPINDKKTDEKTEKKIEKKSDQTVIPPVEVKPTAPTQTIPKTSAKSKVIVNPVNTTKPVESSDEDSHGEEWVASIVQKPATKGKSKSKKGKKGGK